MTYTMSMLKLIGLIFIRRSNVYDSNLLVLSQLSKNLVQEILRFSCDPIIYLASYMLSSSSGIVYKTVKL
jgi:hypothetical protein